MGVRRRSGSGAAPGRLLHKELLARAGREGSTLTKSGKESLEPCGKLPAERGKARRAGSGEGRGDDAPAAHPAGAGHGSGSCRWEQTKAWSKDGGKD